MRGRLWADPIRGYPRLMYSPGFLKRTLALFALISIHACSSGPGEGGGLDAGLDGGADSGLDAGRDAGPDVDVGDVCGDGELGITEACDDGNTESGDGCDSNCKIEPPIPITPQTP